LQTTITSNINFPVSDKNLTYISPNHLQKSYLLKDVNESTSFPLALFNDFSFLNLSKFNTVASFETVDPLLEVNPIDSFLFLRKSTVTSFFMVSLVDMPISLKKSKSLYVKTFEIQSLKLSNLLMRSGKRGLILKTLTQVISSLSLKWNHLTKSTDLPLQWQELYFALANLNLNRQFVSNISTLEASDDVLGEGTVYKNRLETKNTNFFKDIFTARFEDFYPLFNFYIQKTDKSKIKNSRGKVSKLKLLWKYVPPYKRFYQALRWLLKDLKFQKSNAFSQRLFNVFETFCLTPELSFLWKLRNFVHFYVFRNFKKTLLRTLRSSS
jgi:hypothetical protein